MLNKETEEKEKIKNDLISEELSELMIGLICVITASCLFGYIGYRFCLDSTYDIQKGIVCGALFPIVMGILIECDPCKTENKFMYIIYAIIYFIISQYISAYIGIAILFLIVIGFIVYFVSILKKDRTKEVEKSYNLQQTFKGANNKKMTEKQIRMNKKEKAVMGIINHNMKITYLFLKYPNSAGYRFVGVFKKDVEAIKKSIKDKQYKVVYSKIDDKLDLKQFFE